MRTAGPDLQPDPDPVATPRERRDDGAGAASASAPGRRRRRLWSELEHPGQAVAHLTPNWFASVMGTGVVAVAASSLPVRDPLRGTAAGAALDALALAFWVAAALLLVLLLGASALHWGRHPATAREYARHPVMANFYGAPAMGLLTVGAGAHLVGERLVGAGAGLVLFAVLWVLGTALGLATAVLVPFRAVVSAGTGAGASPAALPAWMMPVVPPMVSASTGALLVPVVPAGQPRLALLLFLVALFGLSLVAGLMTATLVHGRLLTGGPLPVQAAPTTWITLGVVGQSMTAALLLGTATAAVAGDQVVQVVRVLGVVYAAAMGGFGALLLLLAAALTAHAARRGLRFSLTWWSFTFPVGTCVTGTSALGAATGSVAVDALAVALFALLLVAWGVVAARTARGAATGALLLPARG